MALPKRKLQVLALLAAVAAGLGLLHLVPPPGAVPERTSPRDFAEVIGIARGLGLHYRSERQDGQATARLIVSESPLTWERANAFCAFPRKSAGWEGTAAVCKEAAVWKEHGGLSIMPDDRMEPWGPFLMYGDPSLIDRLTARPRQTTRRPADDGEQVYGPWLTPADEPVTAEYHTPTPR